METQETYFATPADSEVAKRVYHYTVLNGPRVNVSVEKNTKGFNFDASVSGAGNVDEAIALIQQAESKLSQLYGAEAMQEKINELTARLAQAEAERDEYKSLVTVGE